MKLETLKNPYPGKRKECHNAQVKLGMVDWMRVYKAIPLHGAQDVFLSMLFKRFIELTQNELPKQHGPNSEKVIAELIGRLSLNATVQTARPSPLRIGPTRTD